MALLIVKVAYPCLSGTNINFINGGLEEVGHI